MCEVCYATNDDQWYFGDIDVMGLQRLYMAVIQCPALNAVEEDWTADDMVNWNFSGDSEVVIEEDTYPVRVDKGGWFTSNIWFNPTPIVTNNILQNWFWWRTLTVHIQGFI